MRHAVRGVTVVEILLVAFIGSIVLVAIWGSLTQLTRSEGGTDKEAARSIMLARMTEMLQIDIRSAREKIDDSQPDRFVIKRNVVQRDGTFGTIQVVWAVERDSARRVIAITRQEQGEAEQRFAFDRELAGEGKFDSKAPQVKFKIKPLGDVVFDDDQPAPAGTH